VQFKTPYVAKLVYPSLIWDKPNTDKKIFITFDDGPHPEITPLVLKLLDQYNAKATFFCVGENVENFPETYSLLRENGHSIGNHTFNHLNGWKTANKDYFENVEMAAEFIQSYLFRPPYGRISPSQIKHLKKKYQIIMWSALSYDFDPRVTKEECLKLCIKNSCQGSIIVFHDSVKAKENMLFALEGFLKHFSKRGYDFCVLN
jgi:peptidoglycan/xylan/chitin deacetylase (PgdA/CDA1 family)